MPAFVRAASKAFNGETALVADPATMKNFFGRKAPRRLGVSGITFFLSSLDLSQLGSVIYLRELSASFAFKS
jgi:hypothetical protein